MRGVHKTVVVSASIRPRRLDMQGSSPYTISQSHSRTSSLWKCIQAPKATLGAVSSLWVCIQAPKATLRSVPCGCVLVVNTPSVNALLEPVPAKLEVDVLSVITTSRGCFERCCSNRNTPPYNSKLNFATSRTLRPTLLHASAYRTPPEASSRRRCGHASRFLSITPS